MHHAPRATRQLRFDATEWESPTIAQVAVLLFRFAEYAESAENKDLLLSFLGFKIPRQQSPPTYLKVAHNTE